MGGDQLAVQAAAFLQNQLIPQNQVVWNQPQQYIPFPKPKSNAAALGAMSVLGLLGVILSNDFYVQLWSLTFSVECLLIICAISDTNFGKANFVETFVPQHITKEWAAAVAGAAIVGIACNPSIVGLGS